MSTDKKMGNVSLPYSIIAMLHGLRVKIGLATGKTPTIRSIVLDAIKKHLEEHK